MVNNVGLPAIGRSLHGQADTLQWAVNGYLLPLSALLLLGGALGDRFGKRRMLVAGVIAFAAGSAGCAAAPSLAWLIAARVFQGVGAAMVLPNSLAILGASFEGPARSRAVGFWAASGAMASAVGPVLGGWLIDTVGWRAIFLINVPLALIAAGLALYAIQPGLRAGAGKLDLSGAALVTLALTGLTWGLTEGAGEHGWTPASIGAVFAGALFAAAFVRNELKLGDAAMTPPALFGARPLVALNLLTLLLYGAVAGFLLLVPYLLITVVGYSAVAAGAALLPMPAIMALLSPPLGDLAGRIGAKWPLIAGACLVAAGCLLAPLATHRGPYWTTVLPSIVAVALGMASRSRLRFFDQCGGALGRRPAPHRRGLRPEQRQSAQLGGVIAIALIGAMLAQRRRRLYRGVRRRRRRRRDHRACGRRGHRISVRWSA